jgi:hypothetical protein
MRVLRIITNSRVGLALIVLSLIRYVLGYTRETRYSFLTCGSAAGTNSGCGAGADSTTAARSDRAVSAAAVEDGGWSDMVYGERGSKVSVCLRGSNAGNAGSLFLVVLVLVTGKTGCVFVCAVEIGSNQRWKGDLGEGKARGESDSDTIKRQRVCGARRWTWTHSVGRVLLLGAKVEVAVGLECQHLQGLAGSTGLQCQFLFILKTVF